MAFIEKSIPLYLQSDVTSGVIDLTLQPALDIPVDAKNVTAELVSATLHNTFYNLTGTNEFKFTVTPNGGSANPKTIPFPAGAYDVDSIQETIDTFLLDDHELPDTLFEVLYNNATQRVTIRVDFTQQGINTISAAGSTVVIQTSHANMAGLAGLLGFATSGDVTYTFANVDQSQVSNVGTLAPALLQGPDTIQVRSDLIVGAIDRFGHGTNILAEFPAPAKGTRIHFEQAFTMPHEFAAANGRVDKVRARLTDQDGVQLKPVERAYQLHILIKYLMWVPTPEKTMAGLVGAGAGYRGY